MIFELNEFHRNINSNELIEDLRHVAEFLNQDTVTIDDYNQHGRFHATTLRNMQSVPTKNIAVDGAIH